LSFGFEFALARLAPLFPPNACRGERRGVWGRAAPKSFLLSRRL
jgi:hypothetical protein